MKINILLLGFLLSGFTYAQDWVGTWKTNELITYKTIEEYVLTPANLAADATKIERFGNFIVFNADQTFESYYTAPCGNDCFTTTAGIYTIKDENQIALTLYRLNQEGMCMQSRTETVDLGIYDILKEKDSMRLVKRKK
ncbi:hypothetical protein [Myroides sp. DW712]|uniref:hypothetical protein n=1 Tax=Myroides sp. DW712 TaxID=3389800 RepID=UPI00397C7C52